MSASSRKSSRDGMKSLRDVQSRFAAAIMTPLASDWTMRQTAPDGRPMTVVAGEIVKPNDRFSSFERLEIYNKLYWFRLIDIMYEDYAGLATILGRKRFNLFAERYLVKYPSRSGLLRNLGRSIARFIEEEPTLTAPYTDMALEMARVEWAQVEAFDAPEKPPLSADDLLGKNPAAVRLALQPNITLLDLRYAVDRLMLAAKKQGLRGEASNATDELVQTPLRRRSAKPDRVWLAVHRANNSVFLKRMEPAAFAILKSLRDGATITAAIESATPDDADPAAWVGQVQEYFRIWMALGWFCKFSA
jgi:hypothetical protein